MVKEIIDSDEVNKALRIIASIKEVKNPLYKKPVVNGTPPKGSIPRTTNDILAANLSEVIQQREKRYNIKLLSIIKDICDNCTDCSDCGIAMEVRAADMCDRVKRNLIYMGVIEP